eukprot:ANDGO_01259.mRNA.1 hypothetical protein
MATSNPFLCSDRLAFPPLEDAFSDVHSDDDEADVSVDPTSTSQPFASPNQTAICNSLSVMSRSVQNLDPDEKENVNPLLVIEKPTPPKQCFSSHQPLLPLSSSSHDIWLSDDIDLIAHTRPAQIDESLVSLQDSLAEHPPCNARTSKPPAILHEPGAHQYGNDHHLHHHHVSFAVPDQSDDARALVEDQFANFDDSGYFERRIASPMVQRPFVLPKTPAYIHCPSQMAGADNTSSSGHPSNPRGLLDADVLATPARGSSHKAQTSATPIGFLSPIPPHRPKQSLTPMSSIKRPEAGAAMRTGSAPRRPDSHAIRRHDRAAESPPSRLSFDSPTLDFSRMTSARHDRSGSNSRSLLSETLQHIHSVLVENSPDRVEQRIRMQRAAHNGSSAGHSSSFGSRSRSSISAASSTNCSSVLMLSPLRDYSLSHPAGPASPHLTPAVYSALREYPYLFFGRSLTPVQPTATPSMSRRRPYSSF